LPRPAEAISHATSPLESTWKDHCGTIDLEENEFLVSEPYAAKLNLAAIQELDKFVALVGGAWAISANSEHYPGQTIRIVIAETPRALLSFQRHEEANVNAAERANASASAN